MAAICHFRNRRGMSKACPRFGNSCIPLLFQEFLHAIICQCADQSIDGAYYDETGADPYAGNHLVGIYLPRRNVQADGDVE
jgi:hypothetical protein